jgi:hypothetical protein
MSCLFNSFAAFFKIKTSSQIRHEICNYLESNRELIDGIDTALILSLDRPNYVKEMRNPGTWGGGVEIKAACNIWGFKVIVVNLSTGKSIEFLPLGGKYNTTLVISWNGSHYEPVKKFT